jgi:SAM-dependent methyltransferase
MTFQAELYPNEYFDERLHRVTAFAATQRKWRERDRDILALAGRDRAKTLLELGSALGDACFLLAPHFARVIGIDASPRALAMAEEQRRKRGLENIQFVSGDVAGLDPIPDRSIDVAGAFDLLEHIDDETALQMLRSLKRVLKEGGILVAYTPNREHYVERMKAHDFILKQFPEHIAVRRPREITRLFAREGWRVFSLTYSPAPFPFVRWLERAVWRIPGLGRPFRYRILLKAVPSERSGGAMGGVD